MHKVDNMTQEFEKWLNEFCISNFHYSYASLISLSKVDGKIIKVIITAMQDYYKNPVNNITRRKVTVCDKCFMASCWQGIFMCDDSRGAGTIEKYADELDKLKLEHPSYYSEETIASY